MFSVNIFTVFFATVWPDYMSVFFHTALLNPDITFTVVTNLNESQYPQYFVALPVHSNVKILQTSMIDIEQSIAHKLNLSFDVRLEFPYKLCDYRPMFGKMFEDDLIGYDYWGWMDGDVIVGAIRQSIFDNYDNETYITNADDVSWIDGPLTIAKNTPEVVSHYLAMPQAFLKTALLSQRSYLIDEVGFPRHLVLLRNAVVVRNDIKPAMSVYYRATPTYYHASHADITQKRNRLVPYAAGYSPSSPIVIRQNALSCDPFGGMFLWFKGKLISQTRKGSQLCGHVHFGGGNNAASRQRKRYFGNQMLPFYNLALGGDTSYGFGGLHMSKNRSSHSFFYFQISNDDGLDMHILPAVVNPHFNKDTILDHTPFILSAWSGLKKKYFKTYM